MKLIMSFSLLLAAHASEKSSDVAAIGTYAYEKYRPDFHFLPINMWMNDPCGPYYDKDTSLFHLFYQRNPHGTTWGDMTWGHAVSMNLVEWQDYPDAMQPDSKYDSLGVFSGQVLASAIDNLPTAFYTGVTALPISFSKEYKYGEHVLYATSSDHGLTWKKGVEPLILNAPKNLNVTGFRDPFVFQSKLLDNLYGKHNYMILAGGIRDKGPCIFLYTSPTDSYTDWTYKGILFSEEKKSSFSVMSGNWGYNFEMVTFMEIEDEDGNMFNVLFIGEENDKDHHSLWMIAKVGSPSETGILQPQAVGIADNSDWYASNVFKHPVSQKYIVYAWMKEDNGRDEQPQGWNGILALPREVSIATVRNIFDPLNHLSSKGSWLVQSHNSINCGGQEYITSTIKTLGIKPIPELAQMRISTVGVETPAFEFQTGGERVLSSKSKSFELYAEISDFEPGSQVGFRVRQNTVDGEYTSIFYDDAQLSLSIDRRASSNMRCPESSGEFKPATTTKSEYFKIYQLVQGSPDKCSIQREKLRIRIFVDVSIAEVFVNDRAALSARIYPCESATNASDGIAAFSSGKASFDKITVWPKMKSVWPDYRPKWN